GARRAGRRGGSDERGAGGGGRDRRGPVGAAEGVRGAAGRVGREGPGPGQRTHDQALVRGDGGRQPGVHGPGRGCAPHHAAGVDDGRTLRPRPGGARGGGGRRAAGQRRGPAARTRSTTCSGSSTRRAAPRWWRPTASRSTRVPCARATTSPSTR